MSIYGFEGIKVLLEEVDMLVDQGWELESCDTEWGTAHLYRPLQKVNPRVVGGSLHMEVPSYMPVKPTRRHALSNPSEAGDQEERLLRAGEANRKLATLTTEERQVLLLQARRYVAESEVTVAANEAAALLDAGWFLVRQESGMVTLSGRSVTERTQAEIAELLDISQQHVSRLLKRAYEKLRRFR